MAGTDVEASGSRGSSLPDVERGQASGVELGQWGAGSSRPDAPSLEVPRKSVNDGLSGPRPGGVRSAAAEVPADNALGQLSMAQWSCMDPPSRALLPSIHSFRPPSAPIACQPPEAPSVTINPLLTLVWSAPKAFG